MLKKRGVTILVGLAMVLLSVNGAVARENSQIEVYQGRLVGPVPDDTGQYNECYRWSQCQELQGIAIQNFDVSDIVDEEAEYDIRDLSLGTAITTWHICWYDATDEAVSLLDCDWNLNAWSKSWGDLPADTDHIRILVENGVAPEYYFRVII